MNPIVEDCPSQIQNSVLIVEKDGTVLYSNEANETLLHEWNVVRGEKLPSCIGNVVQRVIFRNSPEKMEVKAGNRVYLVVFYPLPENECVNVSGFDISDKRKIKEKPLESEERCLSIVETANEGIWTFDSELRITFVNKKMSEMLGYSQEELIGRSGMELVAKDQKAYSEQRIEKRLQGIDEVHENKFIRKDGSFLWALVNSKSFFDADGKFTGILAMLTDITERKRMDEELRDKERRLHQALELLEAVTKGAGVIIGAVDTNFCYTYFNKAYRDEVKDSAARRLASVRSWSKNLLTCQSNRRSL
jgi:PAS domain S-box-containing protein